MHLREGIFLKAVIPFTSRQFGRAMVMPNLKSPILTKEDASEYRQAILDALPRDHSEEFVPLMSLYLTDNTNPDDLAMGYKEGIVTAVKFYPANSTTNAAQGVSNLDKLDKVFRTMEEMDIPLLIHGEVTDTKTDIFDREMVFIDTTLRSLTRKYKHLRIVLEHITTEDAVDFVRSMNGRIGATITPHHLIINRNSMFDRGFRPHYYCLPVAKREKHRLALRAAATSGESCFFLGTDSAPHAIKDKESDCGCAGIFSAVSALELYTSIFEAEGKLKNLEKFASLNGPSFYGFEANGKRVTLIRESWRIPESINVERGVDIKPFLAGETLEWKLR